MKKLISILSLTMLAFAGDCWNMNENKEIAYAELDGYITLSFKDSKTCEPIKNTDVEFMNTNMKTNEKGYITFEVKKIEDIFEEKLPLKITKTGYIPFESFVHVKIGSVWNGKYLLSQTMPLHSARFILQWEDKPRDLDLHLVSTDFHLSYREKLNNREFAKLDRDDQDGYGPETITLNKIDENKKYSIYINNYSKESKPNKVRLSIYTNNKLLKVLMIDKFNSKSMQVLNINNKIMEYVEEGVETIPEYIE